MRVYIGFSDDSDYWEPERLSDSPQPGVDATEVSAEAWGAFAAAREAARPYLVAERQAKHALLEAAGWSKDGAGRWCDP